MIPGAHVSQVKSAHHPSSAKVKNEWSYTSTPRYAFMECAGTTSPYLSHKFYFLCTKICALHSPDCTVLKLSLLIPDTMQRRWFKKRVVCVCLLSVFLYLIIRTRTHDVAFEVVIPNSKPVDIFEFVADFSNLKKIYPNM